MKKITRSLTIGLFLILLSALCLTACGGGDKSEKLGVYSLTAMEIRGETVEAAEAPSLLGGDVAMNLELKDDGAFSLTANILGENEALDGGWTEDGEAVSLTMEGQAVPGTVRENALVLDFSAFTTNGLTMTLERAPVS